MILITGSSGFIGTHLSRHFLANGVPFVGIDFRPSKVSGFPLYRTDLSQVADCFRDYDIDTVIHLAAQADVARSTKQPQSYVQDNVVAMTKLLEECRYNRVKHFIFASSSTVYGASPNVELVEADPVGATKNVYAATKVAGESLLHTYAHLFSMKATALRFFTVYGKGARGSMAVPTFTRKIQAHEYITLYNFGGNIRDFVHVDDIVKVLARFAELGTPDYQFEPFNVGTGVGVSIPECVGLISERLGKKPIVLREADRLEDVSAAIPNIKKLREHLGSEYIPSVPLREGLKRTIPDATN